MIAKPNQSTARKMISYTIASTLYISKSL